MPGNETLRGERLAQGMRLDKDLFQGSGGHFIDMESPSYKQAIFQECIRKSNLFVSPTK